MKKVLFLFLLFSSGLSAQIIVDDIDISQDENLSICQVWFVPKTFSSKVTVRVDYGQEAKRPSGGSSLKENGKKKAFNSVVAGLNYFENNGWQLIDTHVTSSGSDGSVSSTTIYTFRIKR
ncbi:MAG: hypothetical protein AB8G15_23440 [Saprospiraceae bacterium]